MPNKYKSIYRIAVDNSFSLNAILKYNKYSRIESINGIHISEEPVASLPKLLQQLYDENKIKPKDDIILKLQSFGCETTLDIFPSVENQKEKLARRKNLQTLREKNLSKILTEEIIKYFYKIYDYKDGLIKTESIRHILPPCLPKITKGQALSILYDIVAQFPVSGALHFNSLGALIFQTAHENFILKYGDTSFINVMEEFGLDLDDGFWNFDFPSDLQACLQKILGKRFLQWKHRNYEGDFFPDMFFFDHEFHSHNPCSIDVHPTLSL